MILAQILTNADTAEVFFLIAAIVAGVLVVLEAAASDIKGVLGALAVGLVAFGLFAL